MFRKTLLASAMLAALASPALANYQQGYIAYQEGRYTSAYLEFKSSAEGGNAPAQYMLGRLFEEGRGVDRDIVQAYAWYDVSARNGYPQAASARTAIAPQLSSYQLQTALNLADRWASAAVATPTPSNPDSGVSPTTASYAPYSLYNLQVALNKLGYSAGAADGLIGPKTRGAIRAYQIDSGLPVSSEPSLALYDHVQQTIAERAGNAQPSPSPSGPSASLIAEVQSELRLRGYAIPSITGQLDSATITAIKRYQADASLSVDGQVTDTLLAQLRSGHSDPAADYRAQVKSVQTALNAHGFDAGPADGALGPRTRAAIRGYQAAEGLSVTGQIDDSLLASLQIAGSGSSDTASSGGSSATVIASIEGELIKHNYAAGRIDGVMDTQARDAIALYQRDAGLTITGQPSQALLDSLRQTTLQNDSEVLSQLVWQIEGELDDKGYVHGPVDGTLDAETRSGIEAFQKEAGLKVNGKASQRLLASLQETDGDSAGDDGQQNVNLLTAHQTWELEARLKARGYDVGQLDTKADAKTYAAVRAYQKNEGLAVTGRLDEQLLHRLQLADAGKEQTRQLSDTEKGLMIIQGLLDRYAPAVQ